MAATWPNSPTFRLLFSDIGANLLNMKQAAPRFGKANLPRLGRHLRDLRLACGQTQAEVATLTVLAQSTVGAVEAGRSNPSLPTIVALSAALGVSIDQIVAAAAAPQGRVAITRAGAQGDLSLGLNDPALRASTFAVPQGQRLSPQPKAAIMLMVLDGVVLATTSTGDRLRLEAGDKCHARDGAISAVVGHSAEAHLLCVADPRRTRQGE